MQEHRETFIGIDLSRRFFTASDPNGVHAEFANTDKGYTKLLGWVKETFCSEPVFIVEARGTGGFRLCAHLIENGHEVREANPLAVKRFREVTTESKNDRIDARTLSLMGTIMRKDLPRVVDTRTTLAIREYSAQLKRITRDVTREINRLHVLLSYTFGPAYRRMFSSLHNKVALSFFREFPRAVDALMAGKEGISPVLQGSGGIRYRWKTAQEKARKIISDLEEQGHFPQDEHAEAQALEITFLIDKIRMGDAQKGLVLGRMRDLLPGLVWIICRP